MTAFDNITRRLGLFPEWIVMPSLLGCQRRELEDLGVNREAIHRAGGLAGASVKTVGRGYTPTDSGDVMVIQPIWARAAPSLYWAVANPQLVDLIAWMPSDPEIWWYRLGDKSAVLGAENLELAHSEGWPITFETTPLAWLQVGCRGAVILDYCEIDLTMQIEH